MGFTESHKRHLLTTFRHVDILLAEAESKLAPQTGELLFPQSVPDATPVQRRVIHDYVSSLRSVMRRFAETERLTAPSKPTSGLWALHVALEFVWIAFAEIEPRHLAGYGALDPEATAAVERFLAESQPVLRQLTDYLGRGSGGDVAARLARLDQTRDEVVLLREIERIVSTHGLVELRATLDWILERLESPRLEVAFFGRVSSGKSSLVNRLIGMPVLPTGATPVTSVPTRIVAGDRSRATVRFALRPAVEAPLDRVEEYVTEERNPANEKAVVDLLLEVTSPRLPEGVCLIDTPGLGSLATEGAEESLAWLPRCDIGVLLVAAGGTLSAEDVSVANAIVESGAHLLPVLSKADLLSPPEQRKLADYIRAQLVSALGVNLRVASVSVKDESAYLLEEWYTTELAPRLRERRSLQASSLRRKIGALRDAVVSALRAHARKTADGPAPPLPDLSALIVETRKDLLALRKEVERQADEIRVSRPRIVESAALAVADSWRSPRRVNRQDPPVEERIAVAIAKELDRLGGEIGALLDRARARVAQCLEEAAAVGRQDGAQTEPLPDVGARPLFDPGQVMLKEKPRPGLLSVFGHAGRRADARRKMERLLGARVERALTVYAAAIRSWAIDELRQLERSFDASAAGLSVRETRSLEGYEDGGAGEPPDVEADLALLTSWDGEQQTTEVMEGGEVPPGSTARKESP